MSEKPIKSIPLARVDGWDCAPPIYTAPVGRTIIGLHSRANDRIVDVTLDNGDVIHVETGAPRFIMVH